MITLGSTDAYVAEELTGKKIDQTRYGAGYIDGTTKVVPIDTRLPTIALRDGKQVKDDGIIKEMGLSRSYGIPSNSCYEGRSSM